MGTLGLLLAWFLSKGVRDSSGFALTYVDSPRRYDAGTLAIGHRVNPTELIPPGQDNFDVYGFCEPSCTSEVSIHTQPSALFLCVTMYKFTSFTINIILFALTRVCIVQHLPADGINVISNILHTHLAGQFV